MEKLIQSTNLQRAHLMDFFEVMNIVASFLQKEDLEALKLTQVAGEFTQTLAVLEDALTQARKTGITESLLETDRLRDTIFIGLKTVLKGMSYFPENTISNAANNIQLVVEKYGKKIQELPQREETAVLINLTEDLKTNDYQQDVQTVGLTAWVYQQDVQVAGLTAWVEKLEQANTQFEELYTQRTEKEAQFVVGLTKTERENMQEIFVKLCRTIEAYALIEGEEAYKPLADKINNEISKVQQAIKRRM